MSKYHEEFIFNNINFITYLREVTIREIIKGKSYIRFGDGEYIIMGGKGIYFQDYSNELKNRLTEVFIKNNKYNYIKANFLKKESDKWIKYKNIFIESFPYLKKIYYHDTLIFRSRRDPKLTIPLFKYLKNKNMVIVHHCDAKFDFIHELGNTVKFIKCKNEHCFSEYDNILKECLKFSKDYIFIISCGPTGKILAYDLTINGNQCIDIGAGFKVQNSFFIKNKKLIV